MREPKSASQKLRSPSIRRWMVFCGLRRSRFGLHADLKYRDFITPWGWSCIIRYRSFISLALHISLLKRIRRLCVRFVGSNYDVIVVHRGIAGSPARCSINVVISKQQEQKLEEVQVQVVE
jgi:hypothetical protein